MEGLKYKNSFLEKYNALPDSTKKNIIAIDTSVLEIDDNRYFFGFNLSDVALFYKNSKMYIHGCEDEGGSRSIHEAICSGCLVALKKNMKGGGRDNLPSQHVLYDNNNYKTKLVDGLNMVKNYNLKEEDIEGISATYTLRTLLGILHSKLKYSYDFEDFLLKCNTNLIQLKMAAHYLTVPWYIKGELTSTLKTESQINEFLKALEKCETNEKAA